MRHDGAVMVMQEPEGAAPSPGVPPPGREEQTRGIDKITTFPIDGGGEREAWGWAVVREKSTTL